MTAHTAVSVSCCVNVHVLGVHFLFWFFKIITLYGKLVAVAGEVDRLNKADI